MHALSTEAKASPLPFEIVKDHTDIPPGFAISRSGLIDAALRGACSPDITWMGTGVEFGFTQRYYDDSEDNAGVREATFIARVLGRTNQLSIDWLGSAGERLNVVTEPLRKLCDARTESRTAMQRLSWLASAYRSPEGRTALDWGHTEFWGAAIWYVANGWLRFTGTDHPNCLGGVWPEGQITPEGRHYMQGLAPVQLYVDKGGNVCAAFDGFSAWTWWDDRWIHSDGKGNARHLDMIYQKGETVPFLEFQFAHVA